MENNPGPAEHGGKQVESILQKTNPVKTKGCDSKHGLNRDKEREKERK